MSTPRLKVEPLLFSKCEQTLLAWKTLGEGGGGESSVLSWVSKEVMITGEDRRGIRGGPDRSP